MNDIDVWVEIYLGGANTADAIMSAFSLLIVSALTSVLYASWIKIHKNSNTVNGNKWSALGLSFLVSTLFVTVRSHHPTPQTTLALILLLTMLTYFMITDSLTSFTYRFVAKIFNSLGKDNNGSNPS